MSKANQLSRTVKQDNIPIELAIATISQASVEEISQALEKVPRSATAKIAVAIGRYWKESA